MAPMVQLVGVSKKYKWFTALSDVSFELAEGEVFGYIGPNGAGKTTTLKILAGLITRFEGQLRIAGKDVASVRDEVHELIGFLPQDAGFPHWHTPDSALRTLGTLSGLPADVLERRMTALLERFDLADVRHKKIKKLSGGMVQKLGVIQALLHEPRLLILDEPMNGLDPVSRSRVKEIIRERRAAGVTVIFSSHILGDVQDVADRVGIVNAGRVVTLGTLDQLRSEFGAPVDVGVEFSQTPADAAFLRATPGVADATERRPGAWVVRLAPGADADGVIHALVDQTLRGGGRLRRIGALEPNLDDLYAQYIQADVRAHVPQSHSNPAA